MLHLIPAPLHRQLYRIADKVRRRWWRIRKPLRRSVLIVAFDASGRVLLVRHSYGQPIWAMPGGGHGAKEAPAVAAAREFREELGCELADLLVLPASRRVVGGSTELQSLCIARVAGEPVADNREVVEVRYFDPRELPENVAYYVERRIERAHEALAARSKQR